MLIEKTNINHCVFCNYMSISKYIIFDVFIWKTLFLSWLMRSVCLGPLQRPRKVYVMKENKILKQELLLLKNQ